MYHIYEQRDVCGSSRRINNNLAIFIIIERDTKEEADNFCESIDMYLNGVEIGRDNNCCGDKYVFLKSSHNITIPNYERTKQVYWKDAIEAYLGFYTPRYIYRIHCKDGSIISSADSVIENISPTPFECVEIEPELTPFRTFTTLRGGVPRPTRTGAGAYTWTPITASMWANTTTTEVF